MKTLDQILAEIINEARAMGVPDNIKSAHMPVQEDELREYFAEETDLAERGRPVEPSDIAKAEGFLAWAAKQGGSHAR